MTLTTVLDPADRQNALTQRVAGLCHLIRLAALAWIGWTLLIILSNWSSIDTIKRSWGHYLKADLTALPLAHYAEAFAVVLFDWAIAALVVVFVWRLFGCYLRGSIFSAEAVSEMRNLGWAGVAAVVADIGARPLLQLIMTQHLGSGVSAGRIWLWAEPNDALHLLMALFIVAVAHIFKTGVEIADDNRQIV